MTKLPLVVLLSLWACGGSRSDPTASAMADLARDAMLIELSRLSDGTIAGIGRAGAFCFYAEVGSPDFEPSASDAFDRESVARLEAADARFTPASECVVTDYRRVYSERGAPAYVLWVDSLDAVRSRVWGTAMVGPGLGQTRGFVCSIRQVSEAVRTEDCSVAWFN